MKKTIMAVSALSTLLICSSSFAMDNKPTGLYLKGFYDYSPNFIHSKYGLGAGYKFGLLRVEGQYSYGQRSYREHSYYANFNYSLHRQDASMLGYLDLDNKTIFSPYIGLGIGYNYFSNSSHDHYFTNYKEYRRFSAHSLNPVGTIGSRIYLNQNLALDLGYKVSLGSFNFKSGKEGAATLGFTYHF
jgi:opacity protein-like surface antigen